MVAALWFLMAKFALFGLTGRTGVDVLPTEITNSLANAALAGVVVMAIAACPGWV